MDKDVEDRIVRLEKSVELLRVCLLQTKPVVEEFYRKKESEVDVIYA